ncbi:MAG: hypothetical protein DRN91_00675 [Candidatus Alkanophagales archaeon]|nr:MAG: hypothetical protein DRN91_00675 [Candidatus Alkanophagales archaeon]
MKSPYDVVIVGAGPAGLGAAITSSSKGLRTALIERSSEIGYPVKSSAFTWKEVISEWGLPAERVVCQWMDSFYIRHVPSDKDVEINFGEIIGGTLNFHTFLQELAFKAIKNGTKMLLSETVTEPIMDGDFVCGVRTEDGKEFVSKVVIDCSGPSAVIASRLGLLPEKELQGMGFEYEMFNAKVRKRSSVDLYVGESIVPIGYAWVFPTGENRARVGVSTVFGIEEGVREIEYYENVFLSEKSPVYDIVKDAQPFEIHKGESPMTNMLEMPYANGLLVAGDAASQNSVLLGEGIRYALNFGKMAAETAYEAISEGDLSEDFLRRYKEKCDKYVGETFEVAEKLLMVPTEEYWQTLVESLITMVEKRDTKLALKYLKCEMTKDDAEEIFTSFVGKYL